MDIPPFPTFIVVTLLSVFGALKLSLQRPQRLVPVFPMHVIGNLLMTLLALVSTVPTGGAHLLARLFGNQVLNHHNSGSDVYSQLVQRHPRIFWYMTGETPESFDAIV